MKNLGAKNAALYRELRRSYQENGEEQALDKAHALLEGAEVGDEFVPLLHGGVA